MNARLRQALIELGTALLIAAIAGGIAYVVTKAVT